MFKAVDLTHYVYMFSFRIQFKINDKGRKEKLYANDADTIKERDYYKNLFGKGQIIFILS